MAYLRYPALGACERPMQPSGINIGVALPCVKSSASGLGEYQFPTPDRWLYTVSAAIEEVAKPGAQPSPISDVERWQLRTHAENIAQAIETDDVSRARGAWAKAKTILFAAEARSTSAMRSSVQYMYLQNTSVLFRDAMDYANSMPSSMPASLDVPRSWAGGLGVLALALFGGIGLLLAMRRK